MTSAIVFLTTILLTIGALARNSQELRYQKDDSASAKMSATMILQYSEEKVRLLQQQADVLKGSMKAMVSFSSEILGKKSEGKGVYQVTVENGMDVENRMIEAQMTSDSTFAKMMDRESQRRLNKPMLHVFDSAFPWNRPLLLANDKKFFDAKVASDTAVMAGKRCYLIEFRLDAEGDSVDSEGNGKI